MFHLSNNDEVFEVAKCCVYSLQKVSVITMGRKDVEYKNMLSNVCMLMPVLMTKVTALAEWH